MNAQILRLLWSVVLEISPDKATGLADDVLVRSLLGQINCRCCLSLDEQTAVRSYLRTQKLLIREMIQRESI